MLFSLYEADIDHQIDQLETEFNAKAVFKIGKTLILNPQEKELKSKISFTLSHEGGTSKEYDKIESLIYDIQRITSNGHDFLDSLRNNIVWNKTKEAAGKVGGYTISILMDLGKEYIKKQVGL